MRSFAQESPAVSEEREPGRAIQAEAVEREYEELLELDDAAQAEVDQWIREARTQEGEGTVVSKATLRARIEQRLSTVTESYEDFLKRYPDHARARLAYGSFLNDIGEEEDAVAQWEKARELHPANPAAWNNLANHYGHRGPVKKAFEYYEKAMELNPEEPVYVHNLAITTYLFRKDAKEYYGFTEEQVFDRSLELYRKAIKLDPDNFTLASDYAQSFYGIKPLRAEEAIQAWNEALALANDEIERQGVYIHLARIELNSGRFEEAQKHLDQVTHEMYGALKQRLLKNLNKKKEEAGQ